MSNKVSRLLSSEDYWAIWLGAFFLLLGSILYLLVGYGEMKSDIEETAEKVALYQLPTISSIVAAEKAELQIGAQTTLGKKLKNLFTKPKTWDSNPFNAFYFSDESVIDATDDKLDRIESELEALYSKASYLEEKARESSFQETDLNNRAIEAAELWKAKKEELDTVKSGKTEYNILGTLLFLGVVLALIFGVGAFYMGHTYLKFALAFIGVFALAVLAFMLSSQADMKNLGINYAVWAIIIGLIISNSIGVPAWLQSAIQTEYYIKTGLVLLGAEILLSKILAIGLPGIFVAWIVTPIVLVSTYWFGQKILRIGSKTLNITISADMSVCGVSAAIATAAACNAKKEELTLAVGLSMVFTSIMMIALPAFINYVGIAEVLGGAWIGGTIDATGAVVAAGAFLGDKALNVAATIKMIQNVLIGLIAFGIAVYWATKVENDGKAKVGISEIWKRFPKFILGFFGASIIFSIIYMSTPDWYSSAFIDHGLIGAFTKNLRSWLFCLAFVSIGLSVNFRELKTQFSGGKPLILYVCGQSLNLLLTLLMAYLMFYVVFPEITEMI